MRCPQSACSPTPRSTSLGTTPFYRSGRSGASARRRSDRRAHRQGRAGVRGRPRRMGPRPAGGRARAFRQGGRHVAGGAGRRPQRAAAQAELEQLLDRISALDVLALREGDGFTESRSEPAAIDELLSAATFEPPSPKATTAETVALDLERMPRDVPIPLNQKVLSYVELFQGRLHDFMQAAPRPGPALPADDPGRLQEPGYAARSGVRAAGRKRVQDQRAVARQRQGHVAVHGADRHGIRPQAELVHRRAVGSRKGHARGRAVL